MEPDTRRTATGTDEPLEAWSRLAAYLAGEGTPEGRAEFEAWVAAAPERGAVVGRAREQWSRGREPGPVDVARAWDEMARRKGLGETRGRRALWRGESGTHGRTGTSWFGRRWMAAALAAGGALAVADFVLRHAAPASTETHTYRTAPGQWSTVSMHDQSTILLAPGTSVVIEGSNVSVTGEAYFSVVSHRASPFVVRTRNAVIRVLGTRFDVRQYPAEPVSRVVVDEGKVVVDAGSRGVGPRVSAVFGARSVAQVTDSGIVTELPGTTRDYTSWTRGELIFNGLTLREVVAELSRAYDVNIDVRDSVLARKPMVINVSVRQESLAQVLDLIGLAAEAHCVRSGKGYLVVPGRRSLSRPVGIPFPQSEKHYGR